MNDTLENQIDQHRVTERLLETKREVEEALSAPLASITGLAAPTPSDVRCAVREFLDELPDGLTVREVLEALQ